VSRVVVVGAGLGGLAVAARLARQRHQVVVVEAADSVGGKIGRLERGGFAWDTGPSLVTLPATLRDLFLKTGKPLETVVDLELLEPLAHYRWADGTALDLPNAGVADVSAAFAGALGGQAGEEWTRFYEHASRLWSITRGPFLESPLDGGRTLATLALRHPRQLAAVAPWRRLRDVGRRFFTDPRQRMFLDRYATYSGSDPRRAPAALAVVPYVEQTFRGWTVHGGLRRLVDAVHERAVERGVTVMTGTAVTSITTAAGRVDGVELADGRRLAADLVVSDVDARSLYGTLLPTPGEQQRLRRATASLSGFTLLLGVRGRTPGVRPHSVLFPADYDAELDAVFGDGARPVDDPTLFVSVSTDPALAPPGDESWFVLVNAPRHGSGRGAVDWDAHGVGTSYRERVLDLLAGRGFDIRDRVAVVEHRTPADLERLTGSPGGAIYGSSSNGARAAFLRPANRSPVPGLFLVGGSAHPGGGIPLVTLSAAIVAEMIGRA
jgi:phytoene desaturase